MRKSIIFGLAVMLVTITAFTLPAVAGSGKMGSERSAASQPGVTSATNAPLLTSNIIGKEVRGEQGEKLGKIDDLIVGSEGSISYALVVRGAGMGAEMGVAEKHTPVPWTALKTGTEKGVFSLNISKARFDKAPTLSKQELSRISDPQFERSLHGYFGQEHSPEHKGMKTMEPRETEKGY